MPARVKYRAADANPGVLDRSGSFYLDKVGSGSGLIIRIHQDIELFLHYLPTAKLVYSINK